MQSSNFSSEFTKNDIRELILREAERGELAYYAAKRRNISLSPSLLLPLSPSFFLEMSQHEQKLPTRYSSLVYE